MNFIANSAQWAQHIFQHARLGDRRRVKRRLPCRQLWQFIRGNLCHKPINLRRISKPHTFASAMMPSSRGFQAHSVLPHVHQQSQVVDLIEQHLWIRDIATKGKRKDATKRPYVEKESFKWQRASQNMARRLGQHLAHVVSVCDREADLIEYLQYILEHQQRFVVRSMIIELV